WAAPISPISTPPGRPNARASVRFPLQELQNWLRHFARGGTDDGLEALQELGTQELHPCTKLITPAHRQNACATCALRSKFNPTPLRARARSRRLPLTNRPRSMRARQSHEPRTRLISTSLYSLPYLRR